MLFSFASVALSVWLGVVAFACLRRVWRAAANHCDGHSNHDYARSTRGENYREHRRGDRGSEGLMLIACRSILSFLRSVTNAFRAVFNRTNEWISTMLRGPETANRPLGQISSIPSGISDTPPVRLQAQAKDGVPKLLLPNRSVPAKGKRRAQGSRQNLRTRCKSPQSKQLKIDKVRETDAAVALELPKGNSEKKPEKASRARVNTAKEIVRKKPKRSSVSNSALTSKISV